MQKRPTSMNERLSPDVKVFRSREIIIHPQFDFSSRNLRFDYDIAMVKFLFFSVSIINNV